MRAKWIVPLAAATAMALFAALEVEAADVKFQIRNVEFKENGRLDSQLMGLCDAKQSVRDAVVRLRGPYRKKPTDGLPEVDIRIDKIARLAAGNSGVRWGGLEFGVTAILVAQPDVEAQFLCRHPVLGIGGRSAYCPTIDECSFDVSKKLFKWMKVVKPAK
ncbi:MAG TPA: hypothetical protein VK629_13960 [Steroidobacteraceae bacterium]|nr:hypothetical protein [Steroidobacteraceae bacterium]